MSKIASVEADVAVIEVGASPVEPYNSDLAIGEIADNIRATILCVADPYAVLGVTSAFKIEPDLVTGVATSTEAGTNLITSTRYLGYDPEFSDLNGVLGQGIDYGKIPQPRSLVIGLKIGL